MSEGPRRPTLPHGPSEAQLRRAQRDIERTRVSDLPYEALLRPTLSGSPGLPGLTERSLASTVADELAAAGPRATVQDMPVASSAPPARPLPTIEVATPPLTGELDPRLVMLRDPDSPRSAAFRVLRHRLTRADARVIAVSSAEKGEGKTTCAANLAIALGEADRARVLLVEANVRSPELAALFGIEPKRCFAVEMQEHRAAPLIPWSAVQVGSPSLHVMAVVSEADKRPQLAGPALGYAVSTLAPAYDYVVIDCPSVLGSADVNLIEDSADGVLLVAQAGRSTARALKRAIDQLSPVRLFGLTLLLDN